MLLYYNNSMRVWDLQDPVNPSESKKLVSVLLHKSAAETPPWRGLTALLMVSVQENQYCISLVMNVFFFPLWMRAKGSKNPDDANVSILVLMGMF